MERNRTKVDELNEDVGHVKSKLARAEEEREEVVKVSRDLAVILIFGDKQRARAQRGGAGF